MVRFLNGSTGRPLCVFVFRKRIYEGYEKSSENCTFKSSLGLNISIKLNITSCMVRFRLLGPSKAYFWPITDKTRKGDKACNLATVSRNLLHFKLELTQKYWKSYRNATDLGGWVFLYLFAEFELDPSISFRENRCRSRKYIFLNMIGAKLSDQRNSRN